MSELAELIRKVRGQTPQTEFGERFGVPKQAVSAWERGIYKPSETTLEKMGIKIGYRIGKKAA
jgi:DNA-binding transcriptional regulator YiaG